LSIRFQADDDLKFGIVKAVPRSEPAIDFASAREAGLQGVSDPDLLRRAANEGRVLVSHDRRTMLDHFRAHLAAGKKVPLTRVQTDFPAQPAASVVSDAQRATETAPEVLKTAA
jgi:hypothetical protein